MGKAAKHKEGQGAARTSQPDWLDPIAIQAIFDQAPDLGKLVDEACDRLWAAFPGDRILLKVTTDPDEPDTSTLVLKVKTSKEHEEGRAVWERFNDKWWLPNYDRSQDRLCILLDF